MSDLPAGLIPKSLSQAAARAYLGCSEDKFTSWKNQHLIRPLEGNLYLITELDALLDILAKRREAKGTNNGPLPPDEGKMGGKQMDRNAFRGKMSRALMGQD